MGRKKGHSGRWLKEHFCDPYVTQAKEKGYRCRAVFKLQEIDTRERLLQPGMRVVDLGATPGGWSEWAARQVGKTGQVIALDVLPMDPPPGVLFIQGDFREEGILVKLQNTLVGRSLDLVMSDMAPNMSGIAAIDQPRAIYLGELALAFSRESLGAKGLFLLKTFQGKGFEALYKAIRQSFAQVRVSKPRASRGRSRETYIVARQPCGKEIAE